LLENDGKLRLLIRFTPDAKINPTKKKNNPWLDWAPKLKTNESKVVTFDGVHSLGLFFYCCDAVRIDELRGMVCYSGFIENT